MQTPDRKWTVEAYVPPRGTSAWFRLKQGDQVVQEHLLLSAVAGFSGGVLAIGTVQRMIKRRATPGKTSRT